MVASNFGQSASHQQAMRQLFNPARSRNLRRPRIWLNNEQFIFRIARPTPRYKVPDSPARLLVIVQYWESLWCERAFRLASSR